MDGDNDDYRVDDHAFIDEPLDDDLSVVSFEGDEDEAEARNAQISKRMIPTKPFSETIGQTSFQNHRHKRSTTITSMIMHIIVT
jgi:hypothetical protein